MFAETGGPSATGLRIGRVLRKRNVNHLKSKNRRYKEYENAHRIFIIQKKLILINEARYDPYSMTPHIPERYREEYENLKKSQLKTRTALFILTAAGVYYIVSFFYLVRYLLGNRDIFHPREFYEWAALLVGSTILYVANQRNRCTPERSKVYGHIFNIFLLIMISRLCLLYPATALVFPFYFALGLIIVSLTIPWSIRELVFLSFIQVLAFSILYVYLVFGLHQNIQSLPRFHCYFDGTLFILISAIIGIVLRKKAIERQVSNFLLLKEVEEKNAQIQSDLEFANKVHQTLMPESVQTEKADITVTYLPVSYVGGDYAKFHFWKDNSLIFFICDVTGHGVAAALMVNRIHTEFERLAKEELRPASLLQKLDQFIHLDFAGSGMFLSAFCGQLDFAQKKFLFSNYGHPPQYFHQVKHRHIEALLPHTTLLGIDRDERTVYQSEIHFESGDRIFLFTDGLLEAVSPSGEQFGSERIKEILNQQLSLPSEKLNDSLLQRLRDFNQGLFTDDVLLLTLQIH